MYIATFFCRALWTRLSKNYLLSCSRHSFTYSRRHKLISRKCCLPCTQQPYFFLHFAHCQLKKIRYQYNYNYFFIWPTRIMMYRSVLYYHNRALHTVHRLYFAFILGHIRMPHHLFWRPRIIPIRMPLGLHYDPNKKNVSKNCWG